MSKTHLFNDSVVLDSVGRSWLGQAVVRLASSRRGRPLFDFTYSQWLEAVKTAGAALGLTEWRITLYVLRHTGPSHDFLTKRRSLAEIQRRGRWSLASSVRRYEKGSRVTSRLNDLPPALLRFVEVADASLPGIFNRGDSPPVPPPVVLKGKRSEHLKG